MDDDEVTGIELFMFGAVRRRDIDSWLADHLHARLAARTSEVLFRSGRIDAVYGIRLTDGRKVVVKIHRPPVDLAACTATVTAQRFLAGSGYCCPEPLDGPVRADGHVVTIETLLDIGAVPDAHQPEIRRALAEALAEQIEILRGVREVADELGDGPAWCHYSGGPWPIPHDSVFDFRTTPPGYEWLDEFARSASAVLIAAKGRDETVIAHGDWYAGNVLFDGDRLVAAFDWDLIVESEAFVAGLSAGSFPAGVAFGAPDPDEVVAFLTEFDRARRTPFTRAQHATAVGAACWVLAYNARCQLSLGFDEPAPRSYLAMLRDRRGDYANLRW